MNNNEWKDGLPPVGEKVMWLRPNKVEPIEVTVLASYNSSNVWVAGKHNSTFIVYDAINELQPIPIKSPEDIEREAEIYTLAEIIESSDDISMRRSTAHSLANDILDADYRKQGKEVGADEIVAYVEQKTQWMIAPALARRLISNFNITRKGE